MAANVTPITARRDRLEEQIRADFTAKGQSSSPAGVDLVEWRQLARKAARSLGRPCRTMLLAEEGRAIAGLTDWPATPAEQEIQHAAMRRAVNAYIAAVQRAAASQLGLP